MTLRRHTPMKPTCHVCGVAVSSGAISCVRHHHAANRKARERTCPTCEQRFVPHTLAMGRGRYCSIACYRVVQNQRRAMTEASCDHCGATFRRTLGALKRVERKFCSRACTVAHSTGPNSPNWRGGHDPNRGPGWQRIAAEIRERDGYRCRRCGRSQEEEGSRLSVDHVIPWRSFATAEEANERSNLVALCRSCHAKKARAERRWLKGDVLDMWRYQVAVSEPWRETVA